MVKMCANTWWLCWKVILCRAQYKLWAIVNYAAIWSLKKFLRHMRHYLLIHYLYIWKLIFENNILTYIYIYINKTMSRGSKYGFEITAHSVKSDISYVWRTIHIANFFKLLKDKFNMRSSTLCICIIPKPPLTIGHTKMKFTDPNIMSNIGVIKKIKYGTISVCRRFWNHNPCIVLISGFFYW